VTLLSLLLLLLLLLLLGSCGVLLSSAGAYLTASHTK